jgi:hypothetical protein
MIESMTIRDVTNYILPYWIKERRQESDIRGPVQRLTMAAIKDELIYQLSSKVKINVHTDKFTGLAYMEINQEYYRRAENVLYRMNIQKPSTPPVFIINTSHLTRFLLYELEQLKECSLEQFDRTVTEAVQFLMEGINDRYYHISGVAYKVSWRFDP